MLNQSVQQCKKLQNTAGSHQMLEPDVTHVKFASLSDIFAEINQHILSITPNNGEM